MGKVFYLDLLERVAWTFLQGALGEWIITTSLDTQTLKVAGVAGLFSVAKALLATQIGDRNSAATLPSPPDYAAPVRGDLGI